VLHLVVVVLHLFVVVLHLVVVVLHLFVVAPHLFVIVLYLVVSSTCQTNKHQQSLQTNACCSPVCSTDATDLHETHKQTQTHTHTHTHTRNTMSGILKQYKPERGRKDESVYFRRT